MPSKEEDKLGQATPRMTIIAHHRFAQLETEDGIEPPTKSVITNFTPLYADNIRQKLNIE